MTDYSQKGNYYIEEPRFELKRLVSHLPSGSRVLDMGAGNGNNTRFLLQAGHSVVAVEPNLKAIQKLQAIEKLFPGRLKVHRGSINTYQPDEQFDAVICCMVIHFTESTEEGLEAINSLKSWTKPGGLNLIDTYLEGQALPVEYSFLMKPAQLGAIYDNWNILWSEESYRLTWSRIYNLSDIPRLLTGRRGFKAARIIARKPLRSSTNSHKLLK